MRSRIRLAAIGVLTGAGMTAAAALVSLIPDGWSRHRFGVYLMGLSAVTLLLALAGLISSGALSWSWHRHQDPRDLERKGETAWFMVALAASVFLLWLFLGPGQY